MDTALSYTLRSVHPGPSIRVRPSGSVHPGSSIRVRPSGFVHPGSFIRVQTSGFVHSGSSIRVRISGLTFGFDFRVRVRSSGLGSTVGYTHFPGSFFTSGFPLPCSDSKSDSQPQPYSNSKFRLPVRLQVRPQL